jgi:hypothetical protein
VIAALDRRGIQVKVGNERHIAILLEQSTSSAWMLFRMNWTLLRAPSDSAFVIADEAVTINKMEGDRATGPSFPFAGQDTELVFPLDPDFVLTLRPNEELLREVELNDGRALRDITSEQIVAQLDRSVAWEESEATRAEVDDINLRSYASAERWLYGRDSAMLRTLHELATHAQADRVAALRPRDPDLVVVHEHRGEPDQVWRAPPRPSRRSQR